MQDLTDTGDNFQKWTQRHHAIFFSFFPTRPSDEYDSAPSRKYSRQILNVLPSIG